MNEASCEVAYSFRVKTKKSRGAIVTIWQLYVVTGVMTTSGVTNEDIGMMMAFGLQRKVESINNIMKQEVVFAYNIV